MKIIIGADHGGYKLKETIKKFIEKLNIPVKDMGTNSLDSVDYPIYAKKVAEEVKKDNNKLGILICGTGLGMSMTANKIKGIRAAVAYNESTAKLARRHNNANILCLGGRELKEEEAKKITKTFIKTEFSNEERHKRRIGEIEK